MCDGNKHAHDHGHAHHHTHDHGHEHGHGTALSDGQAHDHGHAHGEHGHSHGPSAEEVAAIETFLADVQELWSSRHELLDKRPLQTDVVNTPEFQKQAVKIFTKCLDVVIIGIVDLYEHNEAFRKACQDDLRIEIHAGRYASRHHKHAYAIPCGMEEGNYCTIWTNFDFDIVVTSFPWSSHDLFMKEYL